MRALEHRRSTVVIAVCGTPDSLANALNWAMPVIGPVAQGDHVGIEHFIGSVKHRQATTSSSAGPSAGDADQQSLLRGASGSSKRPRLLTGLDLREWVPCVKESISRLEQFPEILSLIGFRSFLSGQGRIVLAYQAPRSHNRDIRSNFTTIGGEISERKHLAGTSFVRHWRRQCASGTAVVTERERRTFNAWTFRVG